MSNQLVKKDGIDGHFGVEVAGRYMERWEARELAKELNAVIAEWDKEARPTGATENEHHD